MKYAPKFNAGYIPFKDFSDTQDEYSLKVALVTRVDSINMKVDLRILTGGGDRFEVDFTSTVAGPRSFWGGVPEVNSLAVIGYRRIHKHLRDAVVLGFLSQGNRSGLRFDPFSNFDPDEAGEDLLDAEDLLGPTIRMKRLLLNPGDVGGMSAAGSELILSKDVAITNRAGDSLELRDSDRTLVTQAVHSVASVSGVKTVSGPIRRSGHMLPLDVFGPDGRVLKTEADGYYGRDELQSIGPGGPSGPKLADAAGKVLDMVNNFLDFPPVAYNSGKLTHYPPTSPGVVIEGVDTFADAFVEHRIELNHTTDMVPDILEEIDGFLSTPKTPYIEFSLGTLVGSDMSSTNGMRQYGKILKPRLFADFTSRKQGSFSLQEIDRQPTAPDLEAYTSAGAVYLRVRPPRASGNSAFVAAVSKQGKLFLNVPASTVDDYPSGAKRVSAEINLEGALKAFIGASAPDRISVNLTTEGGIHLDLGRDAKGNALTTTFRSGTKTIYEGNPNDDDVAQSVQVRGIKELAVTGAENKTIEGSKSTIVSGQYAIKADKLSQNAFMGFSGNYGEYNVMVSGKTQIHQAQAVIENVISGGRVLTVLAGGLTETVAAGAIAVTASAGAITHNAPSGAYTVTVGTGAISITTSSGAVALSTAAGAMSLAAGGGAISITAGLALNLTASTAIVATAPLVVLGGPTAVLGVVRGAPTLPPGVPSLDSLTGLPILGAATVLSN